MVDSNWAKATGATGSKTTIKEECEPPFEDNSNGLSKYPGPVESLVNCIYKDPVSK